MTTENALTTTETNGALAPSEEPRRFVDRLLQSKRRDIETALDGSGVDFDLFRLGVARAIMREPKLEAVSRTVEGAASLAGAVLDCARLGLVPAGYDAQAAIITRNGKVKDADGREKWIDTAQLMVMVGGLIDLALRGEAVREIGAETVRQGETFERDPIADTIRHEVKYPRPKPIVAAYAWAKLADGSKVFEIVDQDEITAARKAGSGSGAWTSWEGEMAKKVAKRRLVRARRLISIKALGAAEGPVSVELDAEERGEATFVREEPKQLRDAIIAEARALPAVAPAAEVVAEARDAVTVAEDARVERLRDGAKGRFATLEAATKRAGMAKRDLAALSVRLFNRGVAALDDEQIAQLVAEVEAVADNAAQAAKEVE